MKTDINYQRVLPRDLFNEAKLLKCVGRLCLLIHECQTPCTMEFSETGEPFKVGLNEEGSLRITNIEITIKGKVFAFKTTYNSKANWPLFVEVDDCDVPVFNEDGTFSPEFLEVCEALPPETEYVNYYRCDSCNVEWQDTWDCMCNDKCPECNAEIEPYKSEEVEPENA